MVISNASPSSATAGAVSPDEGEHSPFPRGTHYQPKDKPMKNITLLAALAIAGLSLTGCAGKLITNNQGFPSVPPGALFSEMRVATQVQERPDVSARKYVVVKPVTAEATTSNFLMLISQGDASYATLKEKALRGVDADDIINLEVDYTHNNILGIVNKVTTVINGTAVKYVK